MSPESLVGTNTDELAARLAPLFGHDLADQLPIVGKQLRALRAANAQPLLGELADIPSLVVSAGYDPIAPPRIGRKLAEGIPGARYIEVPEASHGLPIQFPERVNEMLLEHFQSADDQRATN
jgi:pimeloyl-ACP methyl ester carboxylesterase